MYLLLQYTTAFTFYKIYVSFSTHKFIISDVNFYL